MLAARVTLETAVEVAKAESFWARESLI